MDNPYLIIIIAEFQRSCGITMSSDPLNSLGFLLDDAMLPGVKGDLYI